MKIFNMPFKIRQVILKKMILLDSKLPFQYTAETCKKVLCKCFTTKRQTGIITVLLKISCNFKMAHYYEIQVYLTEREAELTGI